MCAVSPFSPLQTENFIVVTLFIYHYGALSVLR